MISKFLLVGVPRQTRKYIRGSAMTKKIEKHCSIFNTSFDVLEKQTQSSSKQYAQAK